MRRRLESLDFMGQTWDGVYVSVGRYSNADACLILSLEDGETLTVASTNLVAYNLRPQEGCVFVKSYAEGAGLVDALVATGVVERTGRTVTFGPWDTQAEEVRILTEGGEPWLD